MQMGDLLILGLIILFFALFMVTGVDNTIPFTVRQSFDDTCSQYLAIIEADSGLTTAQKSELITKLGDLGIKNVSINAPAPSAGNWGKEAKLTVTGDYTFTDINTSDYSEKTITKPINYEMGTRILALPN